MKNELKLKLKLIYSLTKISLVCVNSFIVIHQAAPTLHNRTSDVKSPAAHPTIAIVELHQLASHFDPKIIDDKNIDFRIKNIKNMFFSLL